MNVQLLIIEGRPEGKCLLLPNGEYVIGRGAECHVRPNSDWVSRQHCLLRVTPTGAFLKDLGSRNGTLVNGVRLLEECPLHHGDQVQVGPLVFEIHLEPAPAALDASGPSREEAAPAGTPAEGETCALMLGTTEVSALEETHPFPDKHNQEAPADSEMPVPAAERG
jgi:predicted component of type VI protein secretion system